MQSQTKQTAQDKATAAVEAAIKKAAQAQAKLMLVEMAEKKQKDTAKRRDENRRKYLAGAWVMQTMKDDEAKPRILAKLDAFLTRDEDRALFGLKPKP